MPDGLRWVKDALSAEHFVHKCTDQLLSNPTLKNDAQAALIVRLVHERAADHVKGLEALIIKFDESPSAASEGLGNAFGVALGWFERLPSRGLVQVVRDMYTALNFAAAGYHVLYTRSVLLDRTDAADMALRHLRDYTPAIRQLSEVLAWAAALDITVDNLENLESVTELKPVKEIVSTLFDCWSSDVPLYR